MNDFFFAFRLITIESIASLSFIIPNIWYIYFEQKRWNSYCDYVKKTI